MHYSTESLKRKGETPPLGRIPFASPLGSPSGGAVGPPRGLTERVLSVNPLRRCAAPLPTGEARSKAVGETSSARHVPERIRPPAHPQRTPNRVIASQCAHWRGNPFSFVHSKAESKAPGAAVNRVVIWAVGGASPYKAAFGASSIADVQCTSLRSAVIIASLRRDDHRSSARCAPGDCRTPGASVHCPVPVIASQCAHWRGNPFSFVHSKTESKAPGAGLPLTRRGGSSARKSSARQKEIP